MVHALDEVGRCSDGELVRRLEQLIRADRALSAKLLVHLGEVEARELFRDRSFSSMFEYCRSGLGMSEGEAGLRILTARVCRKFPLVVERLGAGALHLTAIRLLAPHLTAENHVQLLDRVRGMSKRKIEVLVAELAPKPDVPARMRKLPEARGRHKSNTRLGSTSLAAVDANNVATSATASNAAHLSGDNAASTPFAANNAATSSTASNAACASADSAAMASGAPCSAALTPFARTVAAPCGLALVPTASAISMQPSDAAAASVALQPTAASVAPEVAKVAFALQSPRRRATLKPLSPGRFELRLTVGQEVHDALRQLVELLRHQNPSGDMTCIVERALCELLKREMKRRFGHTDAKQPRGASRSAPAAMPGETRDKIEPASTAMPRETRGTSERLPDAMPGELHEESDLASASISGEARGTSERLPDAIPGDLREESEHASAGISSEVRGTSEPASTVKSVETRVESERAPAANPFEIGAERREAPAKGTRKGACSTRSRHIPLAVRREVHTRDNGQCTFVGSDGRRCSERGFLEIHHHNTTFARGGAATADNLRLACRVHNRFYAEQDYGRELMMAKLREAAAREQLSLVPGAGEL